MAQLKNLLVLGPGNIIGKLQCSNGAIINGTITGSSILNNTAKSALGWNSSGATHTDNLRLINANTLAFWNGAYSGTSSNLSVLGTVTTGTWNASTVAVQYGGTGATSFTTNAVLLGNSTSAIKTAASASGALYSTGTNVAPIFGTLPVAQGGTGNTTQIANRIVYASNATTLSSSNHYMSSTQVSLGKTTAPATGVTLHVEGATQTNGNITTSGDVIAAYVKVASVVTETDKANGFLATIASNSYIRKISYGDAINWGLQKLSTGSSDPQDADYFISQYAGGGTTYPEFYRRPVSALWNYMNKKASSVYAKLASPNNMIHNSNEICWVPDNYNNYVWINYRSVGGTGKSTVTGYKFGNANGKTENVFVEANTFSLIQKANMTYNATDECIEFAFA